MFKKYPRAFYVKCSKCKEKYNQRWYKNKEEVNNLKYADFSNWICPKCIEEKERIEKQKNIDFLPDNPKLYMCNTCHRKSYNKKEFEFFKIKYCMESFDKITICKECLNNKSFIDKVVEEEKPIRIIIEE